MTKIKAMEIKPGMVVDMGEKDIVLVIATKGLVEIEYTHFRAHDLYMGLLIGSIDGKKTVKVVEEEEREAVIQKCLDKTYDRLHDVEKDIDTLRLIQAMSN